MCTEPHYRPVIFVYKPKSSRQAKRRAFSCVQNESEYPSVSSRFFVPRNCVECIFFQNQKHIPRVYISTRTTHTHIVLYESIRAHPFFFSPIFSSVTAEDVVFFFFFVRVNYGYVQLTVHYRSGCYGYRGRSPTAANGRGAEKRIKTPDVDDISCLSVNGGDGREFEFKSETSVPQRVRLKKGLRGCRWIRAEEKRKNLDLNASRLFVGRQRVFVWRRPMVRRGKGENFRIYDPSTLVRTFWTSGRVRMFYLHSIFSVNF